MRFRYQTFEFDCFQYCRHNNLRRQCKNLTLIPHSFFISREVVCGQYKKPVNVTINQQSVVTFYNLPEGPIIKNLETHSETQNLAWSYDHVDKATQKTDLISKSAEPKPPRVSFKKAQSSSELIKLNQNHHLATKPAIKRERLSLKCKQSDAQFNEDSTAIKKAPYRHPAKDLYVIGITGTNGKTSVSHLIGEVLKSAGYKPFVLGTLNSENKDLSTLDSADIEKFMRDHLDLGGTHFIMEVTSEGIDQARVLGVDFNIKLLTSITEDHLDYHKAFEKNQQTKLSFMREGNAHKIHPQDFKNEAINFTTKFLGDFNLLNIKAAASILRHIKISETIIQKTLSSCFSAKGRLETVEAGQQFTVLIDYSHTPDGFENVLNTLKDIAITKQGRLLVLFGCGGNRDPGRRAKMGKIASDIVDFLVITEDNPGMEDSQAISTEIMTGLGSGFQDYKLIQNRSQAIEFIVNQAQENDVVLLTGKGHETDQFFNTETIHFDERDEVVQAISNKLKPNLEGFLPDLSISLPGIINV